MIPAIILHDSGHYSLWCSIIPAILYYSQWLIMHYSGYYSPLFFIIPAIILNDSPLFRQLFSIIPAVILHYSGDYSYES